MNDEELKQFTENMRQLNDVMPNLIAGMSLQSKLLRDQAAASGASTSAYNNASKRMKDGESTVDEYFKSLRAKTEFEKADAEATKKHAEAMSNWTNAGSKSIAALRGFNSALLDTSAGFAKYQAGIEGAGGAISSVLSNLGPVGKAAALVTGALTGLTGAILKQTDSIVKAYDEMAEIGGNAKLTSDDIFTLGKEAGFSSHNLGTFTKYAKDAGQDLVALGGSVGAGAKAFSQFTALGDDQLRQYRKLGYSQDALIEVQSTYLKQQSAAGITLTKSPKELQAASLQYLDSLNSLSALTGISVKKQQEAQDIANANENFNAYKFAQDQKRLALEKESAEQLAAGNGGRAAELKAQAAQIEQVIKAKDAFARTAVNTMGAANAAAALESISTENTTVLTETNAKLAMSGIDMTKMNAEMNKGNSQIGELLGSQAKAAKDFATTYGEAGYAYGKSSKDLQETMGMDNKIRQTSATYNKLETEQERKNFEADLLLTKEELEAKKKGNKDPTIDNTATKESIERTYRKYADELVGLINPFTKTTGAAILTIAGLGVAAVAATLALSKLSGGLLGKLGGLAGIGKAPAGPTVATPAAADLLDKNGKPLTGAAKTAREAKLAKEAATAAEKAIPVATPTVPTPAAGAAAGESKLAKAASSLGKLAGPLSKFAKAIPGVGALAGVVTGGLTAYEGAKQVDADVASGKLTKDEATVQKSEAVGKGTGQAAGGAGGAWAGAAAGAALGSVVPVVGTLIGGILGAAVGGYLGSKGGEMIGEKVGKVAGEKMIAKPIVPTATATPVVPTATPVQNTAALDPVMDVIAKQTDSTEKQVVITTSFNKKLEEATISLGNLTVSFNKFNTSLKDNLDTTKDTATTEKANADSIKGAFIDIDKLRTQITTNKNVSSAMPGTQITTEKNASSVIAGGQTSMSKEQQKWLGGADVTDPFIRERMNKAIPPKPTGEGGDMSKYLQSIAMIESGGNTNAKSKTSSAAGLFQFTDATWKDMTKKMGKDYSLEDKTDPAKATEVAEFFTKLQKTQLEKGTGKEANSTDMYMAHFLGAGGATSFLNALGKDPSKSAAEHVGKKAADANIGIFYDQSGKPRSLDEVYKLMESKIGKAEQSVTAGAFGGKPLPDAVAKIGTSATNKPSTMVASAPATPTAAISSAAPSSGGGTKVASLTPKATDTVTTRGVSSSSKGDKDAGSDMKDLLAFTSNTGSMENFKDLNGNLQQQILAAAADYNETTGKKLIINSAKRASEDQQRLYDETVKAGRPGKGPTGMAVGKPGHSAHERGDAVDIQQGKGDSKAIAALNAKGLQQTVANDPVHFQLPQAKNGGIFNGLESGFPVELHGGGGGELIKRLDPNSILEKLATTPAPIEPPAAPTAVAAGPVSNIDTIMGDMVRMNASMMEMMTDKLNVMIDKLGTSNDLQDQLLKNSLV
jgi:hypothetical protein